MSFLGRVLDPAGVTRGRGSRAFTDPANLQGRGGRGLLDPAGLTGGINASRGGNPGVSHGGYGVKLPDYMVGQPGAVGNPSAPRQQPQGGRGGLFGNLAQQMAQRMQAQQRPTNPLMPADIQQRLQAARGQRAALTGGQPGQPTQPVPQGMGGGRAGVRPGLIAGYADGGKVYDRKPNGKRC